MRKLLFGFLALMLACLLASASPAWPIKKSANGRYLVDSAGTPFFVVGDSPHSMLCNLSDADVTNYIVDRKNHGFNAIYFELFADSNFGCIHGDSIQAFDGTPAFTSPGNDCRGPLSFRNYRNCQDIICRRARQLPSIKTRARARTREPESSPLSFGS